MMSFLRVVSQLFLFGLLLISKAFSQENLLEEAYRIAQADTNHLEQLDGLQILQSYCIDKKDTAALLRLYEMEKSDCNIGVVTPEDYKYCTHNRIAGYLPFLGKEEVLNYIRTYSNDTVVLFNEYTYGRLATIYIWEGKFDSAVYFLNKAKRSDDCHFNTQKHITISAIDELIYYCSRRDKDSGFDMFKSILDKIPNDSCMYFDYMDMDQYAPFFFKENKYVEAALYLDRYDLLTSFLKDSANRSGILYSIKAHFKSLLDSGKVEKVLSHLYIIPDLPIHIGLLADALWEKQPENIQTVILDSVMHSARKYPQEKLTEDEWNYNELFVIVNKLIEFDRLKEAIDFNSRLNSNGILYCDLANAFYRKNDLKNTLKYTKIAYKNYSYDVSVMGEVGRLYMLLGKKKQKGKALSAAEKQIPLSEKDFWYESRLEDVSVAYSRAGEYDIAFNKSLELDNEDINSPRSSCQERIYKTAFLNGDTTIGIQLLEMSVKYLPEITHIHQRHWFIREAAVQYTWLGMYDKAFEVADLLETNTLNHLTQTINEIEEAYSYTNSTATPLPPEQFLKLAEGCSLEDRIEIAENLADLYLKYSTTDSRKLEETLIRFVSDTPDKEHDVTFEELHFRLNLYVKTTNRKVFEKLFETGYKSALEKVKPLEKVKALIALLKLKDSINGND